MLLIFRHELVCTCLLDQTNIFNSFDLQIFFFSNTKQKYTISKITKITFALYKPKLFQCALHGGPENLKNSRPKNSRNQINQFFFREIAFFCHFKNGQKSIFEYGKSLKLLKCNFTKKKLIYLISRVFLPRFF